MKLLPLLLLICLDCGAQIPGSLSGTTLTIATSMTTISSGTLTMKIQEPKFDTVRVIMLVCDTARPYSTWPYFTYDSVATKKYNDTVPNSWYVMVGKTSNDTTFRDPDYRTYWQFGYEVRERAYGIPKEWVWWESVSYLDDRRRPLSKSIIVWQSIKL